MKYSNLYLPGPNKITATATVPAVTARHRPAVLRAYNETNMIHLDLNRDDHNMLEVIAHVKGTDADANVMELWATCGENQDLIKLGSIALTAGKMTVRGGSRLYIDTMVNTEADASFEAIVQNSALDSIAKLTFERNAYSDFFIFATTLNSDDLAVETRTYNRESVPA